ncbi:hypothetical protein [Shewanella baltica]|uniref:hypothetical protein n=1 Tax=Shewanella baltica TaxID=62322 RepID=UPI00217DD093|nr:hypothetical protein [Shewanella baltica]MCS6177756.1 hypothetical protein [Shewanella baltica]MCS6253902.1 hypothetical protein [Shewanella baltica]
MNHLLPGFESKQRIELLLSLTRISSPEVIAALTLHYTSALPAERAAARHGIELSNFMRGQKKLEQIAATVEAIKAIDWAKLQSAHLQSTALLTTPLQPKQVA